MSGIEGFTEVCLPWEVVTWDTTLWDNSKFDNSYSTSRRTNKYMKWCKERMSVEDYIMRPDGLRIYFRNAEDAVAFKLWKGYEDVLFD